MKTNPPKLDVDDGWDVRKCGTPGFVPHPVDKERLRELSMTYNSANIPWLDLLLATFEGKEKTLWENFFHKYELGPKPKEPTWGKGIRKARWTEYGNQIDAWEAKKAELLPKFQEENRKWAGKRAQYDEEHKYTTTQAAGTQLLRRALSGGGLVLVESPSAQVTYRAVVPQDCYPGQTFQVSAGGQMMAVTVPPGVVAGTEITFQAPNVPQVVQTVAAPVQAVRQLSDVKQSPMAPPPAALNSTGGGGSYRAPPPPPASQGSGSAAPPREVQANGSALPPPAIQATGPSPPVRQGSMKW